MSERFSGERWADFLWPVAIFMDRWHGEFSGGLWFAISEADTPHESFLLDPTRAGYCLESGPNSDDDVEAEIFWREPPEWIGVGDTPSDAIAALIENARCGLAIRDSGGTQALRQGKAR